MSLPRETLPFKVYILGEIATRYMADAFERITRGIDKNVMTRIILHTVDI